MMGQLRLTVALNAPPQLSVRRSELCHLSLQPGQLRTTVEKVQVERLGTVRIRDNDIANARVDPASSVPDAPVGPPPIAMRWLVTVDTAGHAQEAVPLTGTRGGASALQKAVLRLRFNPALLDRVPVTMSDTVTIGAP